MNMKCVPATWIVMAAALLWLPIISAGQQGSCRSGWVFMSNGRMCMPVGAVECGDHGYCVAGWKCGSGNQCIPQSDTDCGDGTGCKPGFQCATNRRCIPQGTIDCGNHHCDAGNKCTAAGGCIPQDATDCGDGHACKAGTKCAPEGKCISLDANAQITMVNKTRNALNLYIDGGFGCGPVLGTGNFTNSPGLFCTSSITPGPHLLEARDGNTVVKSSHIVIEERASQTWEVSF